MKSFNNEKLLIDPVLDQSILFFDLQGAQVTIYHHYYRITDWAIESHEERKERESEYIEKDVWVTDKKENREIK